MAFQTIYDCIAQIAVCEHQRLVKYLQNFTSSADLAEECIQHAYLLALLHADQIRRPDRLASWLITVAKRAALRDMDQKKKARCAWDKKQMISIDPGNMDGVILQLTLAEVSSSVLKQFPSRYAEMMRLRYQEGLSFVQISSILCVSADAARRAHHRIKLAMRKELDRE